MSTLPVFNPQVPFIGLIPGGFRPSLMVRVKGVVHNYNGR